MVANQYLKPSFYIVGERKCGTSSLFRYICDHPLAVPGQLKEPNFFINTTPYIRSNFKNYLANFPNTNQKSIELQWPELDEHGLLFHKNISFQIHSDSITGEASANTFVDVDPKLLIEFLPDCKIIILLREPLARTISHYQMFERFVKEGRTIGFHLLPFGQMMEKEMMDISLGRKSPILYPSLYMKSLPDWMETYRANQILIIKSHELAFNTSQVMRTVYEFLGLPPYKQVNYAKYNAAPMVQTDYKPLGELKEYLASFNQSLFHYLGENNPWD